ncbi:hypothetical protein DdX_20974 [Ditylenchus destructor]|uniref:Uncharacterized protein n=1 Tax=Ditylenchus destructor TaxID=166010 RepID=A0AAD4MFQ0_9BILA|nr:hypothetical protein DdX_20974 [Ditylenchus destructor]
MLQRLGIGRGRKQCRKRRRARHPGEVAPRHLAEGAFIVGVGGVRRGTNPVRRTSRGQGARYHQTPSRSSRIARPSTSSRRRCASVSPVARPIMLPSIFRRNIRPKTIDRAARLGQVRFKDIEPLQMLVAQCRQPRVQPRERLAMRGQHQQVAGQFHQPVDRGEPFASGSPSGSVRPSETFELIRGST